MPGRIITDWKGLEKIRTAKTEYELRESTIVFIEIILHSENTIYIQGEYNQLRQICLIACQYMSIIER